MVLYILTGYQVLSKILLVLYSKSSIVQAVFQGITVIIFLYQMEASGHIGRVSANKHHKNYGQLFKEKFSFLLLLQTLEGLF